MTDNSQEKLSPFSGDNGLNLWLHTFHFHCPFSNLSFLKCVIAAKGKCFRVRASHAWNKEVPGIHGVSNFRPSGFVGRYSEKSMMSSALLFVKTINCLCLKLCFKKSSNIFSYRRESSFSCAGVALGRGVYFARDASYSLGYARGGGTRHMYLARVLVGQYCQGNSNMIVPPAKNPVKPEILYESVVDNPANPAAFVVFYDNQCYPEYLITFQ